MLSCLKKTRHDVSQKNFFLSALLDLIRCWQDALSALEQGAGWGCGGAAGGYTHTSARVMFHAARVTPDGCCTQLLGLCAHGRVRALGWIVSVPSVVCFLVGRRAWHAVVEGAVLGFSLMK